MDIKIGNMGFNFESVTECWEILISISTGIRYRVLGYFYIYFHRNPLPSVDEKQHYSSIIITPGDFHEAIKFIQPSAKREGFATVPDVTWDDVGALSDIREELTMSILAPVK